jgi:hypothetical protein
MSIFLYIPMGCTQKIKMNEKKKTCQTKATIPPFLLMLVFSFYWEGSSLEYLVLNQISPGIFFTNN